jgi:hypothetical protein
MVFNTRQSQGPVRRTPYLTPWPSLRSGFLPSKDPAQILFERRKKRLLSKRSTGVLVGTQEFHILFDQMDMIGQQAVCSDLDIVSRAPMSYQFPVALVIFVTKKRLLSTVSPLSDVMGKTTCDNTRQTGRD